MMKANRPPERIMNSSAEPVVENPAAPSMSGGTEHDVMGAATHDAPGPRMTEPAPSGGEEGVDEYPEMEPRRAPPATGEGADAYAAGEQGEGYVRLVIEVDEGKLHLVDAAVIDGPLVQTDLTGQMAYEALIRGRRVAADAFDDLSHQRSFPPPDEPHLGHNVKELSRYQFVARIPRSEVTAEELADLEVTLLRPSRTTQLAERRPAESGQPLADAALAAGEEPPEIIGRLAGVDLDESFSPARAEAVRSRLR